MTSKYFFDPINKEVHNYPSNGSMDDLIPKEFISLTEEEFVKALTPPLTLEQLKLDKVKEATDKYKNLILSDFSYLNTTFQTDVKSVTAMANSLSITASVFPSDFFWVDTGNNKIPMSYDQLKELSSLIALRSWGAFQTLQATKALIEAATTEKKVRAIK
jgi:hypothetical protein